MKLTPFILFCILLLVLVISSLIGNTYFKGINHFEGFQEGLDGSGLTSVDLPQYSTQHNVFNLHDNIYYDTINANLIEVTATVQVAKGTEGTAGNVASSGNTVSQSSTIVTTRTQDKVTYTNQFQDEPKPTDVQTSQLSSVSNSYVDWVTKSTDNKYNLFYMPWGLDTYVHILDDAARKNIATFGISNTGAIKNYSHPTNSSASLSSYYSDTDSANMTMVSEPTYSTTRKVYQLGHFVKYDVLNGNLLILTGTDANKTITVYDINNVATVLTSANQVALSNKKTDLTPALNFRPFTVLDVNGQNLVLYIPTSKKVMVGLISYSSSDKTKYSLKVSRFTENGIDKGTSEFGSATGTAHSHEMNNDMFNFYQQYMFSNTSGVPKNGIYSEDYILKTQIVPPVCPTCPACPATPGTCTNCGGQGGSGTLATTGSSVVKNTNGSSNSTSTGTTGTSSGWTSEKGSGTFSSNANPDTIGGSLTLATYDTVAGVEDVAKTGAGIVTGVASTGAGVITGVANTIGGLGNNAIDSVESILKTSPTQVNNNYENKALKLNQRSIIGPGTQNQYNGVNDPYSYYGQLPARGRSDYMPLNADFSSFGR